MDSNFRPFWLAPVTRNIFGYSLFHLFMTGLCFSFRDSFERWNFSGKWSSCTNKYQEREQIWLVGVYWSLKKNFLTEFGNNARNIVNWNVNKLELSDFYPTDLVNTKTTIPLRICWSADHWAYRSQSPYSAWQRQWRGFRPIGVGEVIRRIIGKCVTRVAKQDVINASGAMQVCAGQKSGGEAAIHAMRNIFEADETDAALLVDA